MQVHQPIFLQNHYGYFTVVLQRHMVYTGGLTWVLVLMYSNMRGTVYCRIVNGAIFAMP